MFRKRPPVNRWGIASLLAVISLLLSMGVASAHEHRAVGDYQLTVGFLNEPAIVEEPNGLDLRVSKGEGEAAQPIEGLADTLKAEVRFGDKSMPLTVEARFGMPGSYRGNFIPTAEGAYTYHITGTIEGTPVDETFTSSPTTFSEVASRGAMDFPNQVGTVGSVGSAAQDAEDTAGTAQMLGIVGIVVGLLGLIAGAAGLMMARNARAVAPKSAMTQREVEGSPAGSQ